MRTLAAAVLLIAALFAPGCTSQDVVNRANDFRSAAEGLDAAALYVATSSDRVQSGALAFAPLLDQVRVWLPDKAASIDALLSGGATAPQVLSQIGVWLSERADKLRTEADALEASASDDPILNAVDIGFAVLLGILGLSAPSPFQRRALNRAIATGAQVATVQIVDEQSKTLASRGVPPHTPEQTRAVTGIG